jgi:hypothetical protein
LHVYPLTSPVSTGDTIYLGSGPLAQTVTATAGAAKNATTVAVTAVTTTASSGTNVYDSAVTTVPNTIPTTLNGAASLHATSLTVAALQSPVAVGDIIVVGSGSSAQTVSATAIANTGATSIAVTSLPAAATSGSEVYDSTCSTTQVSEIQAIGLALDATKNPGGQSTGYQSLAYFLSPEYSSSVG